MKNILVFFGGTTVEHDVSVITGVLTLHGVDNFIFNAIPVYIDNDGTWYTGEDLFEIENYKNLNYKKLNRVTFKCGENKLYKVKNNKLKEICSVYSVINCLHGERGEDGSLAGILSLCKIPFASPSLIPSGISMDKYITKKVLNGIGVKTVDGVKIKSVTEAERIKDSLEYPVIVKPCYLGSSIGIETAKTKEELIEKVNTVFRYDKRVIIEKKLTDFYEINCAVYQNEKGEPIVSNCEKPIGADDILSFNDKYKKGKREFPANIPISIANEIKATAKKIYTELDFTSVIRIDFFVSNGEVSVNEINSVPGSLAYYLFTPSLKEFSKILTGFINNSVKEFSKESTLKRELKTTVLEVEGSKGSKKVERK